MSKFNYNHTIRTCFVGIIISVGMYAIGAGILCGVIFPVIMVIGLFVLDSMKKNRENGVY